MLTTRFCSWNLKFASESGAYPWSQRRPLMLEQWRALAPDIIGTQEGLFHQLEDLQHGLPDYRYFGTGRLGGSRDEHCAIFYRPERVTLCDYDVIWLSDTPRLMASNTWMGNFPRIATFARFTIDDQTIAVANTHLDNGNSRARELGIRQILDYCASHYRNIPVLVMGDFNGGGDDSNPCYRACLKAGFTDTSQNAGLCKNLAYNSIHDYECPKQDGRRIDWIMAKGLPPATHYEQHMPNEFASDHLAVSADIPLS